MTLNTYWERRSAQSKSQTTEHWIITKYRVTHGNGASHFVVCEGRAPHGEKACVIANLYKDMPVDVFFTEWSPYRLGVETCRECLNLTQEAVDNATK